MVRQAHKTLVSHTERKKGTLLLKGKNESTQLRSTREEICIFLLLPKMATPRCV